jgi:hypothetical protein
MSGRGSLAIFSLIWGFIGILPSLGSFKGLLRPVFKAVFGAILRNLGKAITALIQVLRLIGAIRPLFSLESIGVRGLKFSLGSLVSFKGDIGNVSKGLFGYF